MKIKIITICLAATLIGMPSYALYEENNEASRRPASNDPDTMTITSVEDENNRPVSSDEDFTTTNRPSERNNPRQRAFEEQVRTRLSDQQQQIALRTAANINNINQRLSERHLRHLNVMEAILKKITDRSQILTAAGLDMTEVNTAASSAQDLINSIRPAIEAQSQKDYTVDAENSPSIGQALQEAIRELRGDHNGIRNQLMEVRQAVQDTFLTLKDAASTKPEEDTNEETETENNDPETDPAPLSF